MWGKLEDRSDTMQRLFEGSGEALVQVAVFRPGGDVEHEALVSRKVASGQTASLDGPVPGERKPLSGRRARRDTAGRQFCPCRRRVDSGFGGDAQFSSPQTPYLPKKAEMPLRSPAGKTFFYPFLMGPACCEQERPERGAVVRAGAQQRVEKGGGFRGERARPLGPTSGETAHVDGLVRASPLSPDHTSRKKQRKLYEGVGADSGAFREVASEGGNAENALAASSRKLAGAFPGFPEEDA